jgi:hypothetical protein
MVEHCDERSARDGIATPQPVFPEVICRGNDRVQRPISGEATQLRPQGTAWKKFVRQMVRSRIDQNFAQQRSEQRQDGEDEAHARSPA